MKLKRNTWHYKLNDLLSDYSVEKNDFCSYFWLTVWSLIRVIGLFLVASFLTFATVLAWKTVLVILAGVTLILGLVSGGAYVHIKLKDTEAGFFRLAWRKFRDKTCHKLEWE